MSEHETNHETSQKLSLPTYVYAYIACLAISTIGYLLVQHHAASKWTLITSVVALAMVQFGIQLRYFLHLGHEAKPRWKVIVFWLMLLVVIILVFGSIWIMNNLDQRMTPTQMNDYLRHQDSL